MPQCRLHTAMHYASLVLPPCSTVQDLAALQQPIMCRPCDGNDPHTGSSVGDSQAATSADTPLAIYPTPSESNHQNCSPNIPRIIHHNCSPQLLNTTPTSGQFSTDSRHSLTPTQRCRCPCSTAPCQFQLQPVVLEKGTMPACTPANCQFPVTPTGCSADACAGMQMHAPVESTTTCHHLYTPQQLKPGRKLQCLCPAAQQFRYLQQQLMLRVAASTPGQPRRQ